MPTLLGVGLLAAFASTLPWPTLFFVGLLYLATIPLTVRAAARYRRAAAAGRKPETASAPLSLPVPPPAPALGETAVPPNEWRH